MWQSQTKNPYQKPTAYVSGKNWLDTYMMTNQTSFNIATKRGRETEEDIQPELLTKKLQVSREDVQELSMVEVT